MHFCTSVVEMAGCALHQWKSKQQGLKPDNKFLKAQAIGWGKGRSLLGQSLCHCWGWGRVGGSENLWISLSSPLPPKSASGTQPEQWGCFHCNQWSSPLSYTLTSPAKQASSHCQVPPSSLSPPKQLGRFFYKVKALGCLSFCAFFFFYVSQLGWAAHLPPLESGSITFRPPGTPTPPTPSSRTPAAPLWLGF